MKKVQKISIGILILIIASFSLIGEDFIKFLLSGQSATYNVYLVRHHYLLVIGIAFIALLSNFYYEKSKLYKYLLRVSLVLLILSLKTYAVVKSTNNTVLVSGFSFIPINKCEVTKIDNCDIGFGFFLEKKVRETMSK